MKRYFAVKNHKIVTEISTSGFGAEHDHNLDHLIRNNDWDSWIEISANSAKILLNLKEYR
jgi:hypothetical protein